MVANFDLFIGDKPVKTPIAVACMAGITDGAYIQAVADHIGLGIIGGYAIDDLTIQAARTLSDQGREEFLPKNLIEYLKDQIALIHASGVIPGINIRASEAGSLVALAHNLGLKVVAEGVDDESHIDILKECRCDYGQGYYFSKPLSSDKADTFLSQYFGNSIK